MAMQQSLPQLEEAPAAVVCDVDALPSLESSIELPYAGWDFGVYRLSSDRLLILEETYVLEDHDWRAIKNAKYEDIHRLTVSSGQVLVAPMNEDLGAIHGTAKVAGAGVLTRIEPGTYVVRRARAEIRGEDCNGATAFLLERCA